MDAIEWMNLDVPVAAAVIRYGSAWSVEQTNPAFEELFGFQGRESERRSALVARQDLCLLEETMEQALRGVKDPQEVRIVRADQSVRWAEIRCSLLAHVDAIPYVLVLFWDIHERKLRDMKQRLVVQKYEVMEQLSKEFPFDVDVQEQTMLRPGRLAQLRGESPAADVRRPVEDEIALLHPSDQKHFRRALKEASLSAVSGSIDIRLRLDPEGDGERYAWFRTLYRSIADGTGKIERIIGRSFNIDSDKRLQEEVRLDPLTRLWNKAEMQREVAAYLEEKPDGEYGMLLMDIDNFRGINETFGHTYGDMVITDVAGVIRDYVGARDIVGRVGGDEFLIFMKDISLPEAAGRAEELCAALAKDYVGEGVKYHITVSAGLAMYRVDGSTCEALLEKADHAMCRAKRNGKNMCEIATAEDEGPGKTRPRRIERQGSMSQEDQEFLAFAANLLAHAKNLDGSLNMLLKRTAKRLGLDLLAVFENKDSRAESVMTNYYSSVFSFFDKCTVPVLEKIRQECPAAGSCMIFRGSQLKEYRESLRELKSVQHLDMDQPFSFVLVSFEFVDDRTGAIVYLSLDEERGWQQSELMLLQELTRTIAIFVSLRCRMEESRAVVRHMRKRDQLTDLYNQEAFRQKVADWFREAKGDKVYAFEYVDIDNFGYVNENYGYKAGDEILKLLAADISSQSYYVMGCRLYSDFFLLLLEAENREDMNERINRRNRQFLQMLNHRYPGSGMGITVGVCIVEAPRRLDVDAAIENANLAWKYVKNKGGRHVGFFEPELRRMRAKEQQVVAEFFEALYRAEFRLFLQPKFILGERRVYGAEALSRWRRRDNSLLGPGDYIESLERIGYVTELDFYIFEELLRTLERWGRQGRQRPVVSTNFSGRHFADDGEEFLARIGQIMSRYSVPPEYVEIEITEGVLIRNLAVLQKCIGRLHETGFRVAIDDFGTGYSSLSVLADVPADVVKIDQNFIRRDMNDGRLALLGEIGRMIRIIGKDVIIEGVETVQQEKLLLESGFVCGQGYLCNGPIPVEEFEKLYLQHFPHASEKIQK